MVPLITVILQGTIIYPSIIERKHYVRSPRLLKTALFSFERCLATQKKISLKKLNKLKNSRILVSFSDWHSYELQLVFGRHNTKINSISWFALNKASWNPSFNHANIKSKYSTLHNQVLRAETTYVQNFRSVNLLLTPLCPWAHRSVRQGNVGALLIRPLCLQHTYRAMRWISQLGHSACFHPWFVG